MTRIRKVYFSSSIVLIILANTLTLIDGDGTRMRRKCVKVAGRGVITDGKFHPSGILGE